MCWNICGLEDVCPGVFRVKDYEYDDFELPSCIHRAPRIVLWCFASSFVLTLLIRPKMCSFEMKTKRNLAVLCTTSWQFEAESKRFASPLKTVIYLPGSYRTLTGGGGKEEEGSGPAHSSFLFIHPSTPWRVSDPIECKLRLAFAALANCVSKNYEHEEFDKLNPRIKHKESQKTAQVVGKPWV
ncbi:hypothetical protein DFH06DRAFT_1400176 [Mycena polygramma]|nr:hypothetical protein DFH06DRAFT_1400176 [Mycena polygramma]